VQVAAATPDDSAHETVSFAVEAAEASVERSGNGTTRFSGVRWHPWLTRILTVILIQPRLRSRYGERSWPAAMRSIQPSASTAPRPF
jgi:hypothetical protein